MLLFPTKNEQFWEDLWLSATKRPDKIDKSQRTDQNSEGQNGDDPVKRWDRMAGGFNKRSGSPEALKRKEKILSMLKASGALKNGAKVLDIGSGPGNWAIPMAEAGAVITALEPSGEMIKELKKRAEDKEVSHLINIVQKTWQEFDIKKEGFEGRFDLVFASMTPGISNPETLRKAMKAARFRGFCYLSGFSGGGWRTAYKQIWKELFNEEIESHSGDFIYPFNYIYSLGYRPYVEFMMWEQTREESVEDALETILFFILGSSDVEPSKKERLTEYLKDHSTNGIFSYNHKICQGAMLWQVLHDKSILGAMN
ncbi:MAG: class I SAM-dependent methyltransferase [Desulfamplus sp.]|nr:class I SAM-dependent methyltransferase [Desulfamplus sp.]MBF0412947.1 class I SAM-dependent methyltransferase [Desulfamplus sp.]